MKTHTLTVRDRRLSWDDRTLVRGSVAADRVKVALDDEYKACDTVHAVMVSAAHPEPVRMVVEGSAYSIPSELTRETGSILTCLIGYVGDVQRVTSEQETQPLIVVKSGPIGGSDPQEEQPDLWAQLIATVESAERIAQSVRDDADSGKFNGKDGKPGAPGTPGAPGDKGDPGAPGKDGISPSAKVEQTAGGATVSITDKDGTTTATIRNGAKGDPGDKGDPGKDGTSPTASVKQTDTGATITVTDAHGTTTAEIANGRDAIPAAAILTGKTSGGIVNVTDAYPTALLGLSVYGKSVQDGTPSPDAPKDITNLNKAELVVAGKNLINPNRLAQIDASYYQAVDGQLKVIGSHNAEWKDVPIYGTLQAGTYTISGDNIEIRDTALNQIVNINSTQVNQFTLNNPTAIKMKIGYGWPKYPVISKVQLEVGSKATAYEPHKSNSTPIDLKGNELCSLPNGVKDEVVIDAEGNVSLIKRIGISPIPNCISISDTASQTGKDGTLNYIVTLGTLADAKIGNGMPCMCNKLTDGGISKNRDTVRLGANDNHVYVYTSNEQLLGDKSLVHIDNWMKSNEVTIIYELAEPQTIPLGKVELPALPEATSNVWNNGNIQTDVGITYVRDANIVIGRLEDKLARVAYGNL